MDGSSDFFLASSSSIGPSLMHYHHSQPMILSEGESEQPSPSPNSSSSESLSAEARMASWHSQQYGQHDSSPLFSASPSSASSLDIRFEDDDCKEAPENVDSIIFEDEDYLDPFTEEEIYKIAKQHYCKQTPFKQEESENVNIKDEPEENEIANHIKSEPLSVPESKIKNEPLSDSEVDVKPKIEPHDFYDIKKETKSEASSPSPFSQVKSGKSENEMDELLDAICDLFEDDATELPASSRIPDKSTSAPTFDPQRGDFDFDVGSILTSLTTLPTVRNSPSNDFCDNPPAPAASPTLQAYLDSAPTFDDDLTYQPDLVFSNPIRVVPTIPGSAYRKRKVEEKPAAKSVPPPRKRARRQINQIISNAELTKATRDAKRAEKHKRSRLAEKKRIYEENELEKRHPGRIILDFDLTTLGILAEVEPKMVPLLKSHQVDGVKFIFSSIIESVERLKLDDDQDGTGVSANEKVHSFGGILAHCMGLGKTFQVIVFLQSVLSNSLLNYKLKRVLLILPLNVIKNWESEFFKWYKKCELPMPFSLFELHSIKVDQREARLRRWHQDGGVLMVTPKLFSQLINTDHKQESMKRAVKKCLLDPGPDMVFIDEGHCLKNVKSDLNKATSQIRTLRRIILTGTPMQNNLNEYYTMVSFIKPNLLGSKNEFANQFVHPITNGSFGDSTDDDVRLMKRRFFILHKFLEYSTIHRRSYAILEPDLPARYEYVIDCRLTKQQRIMYKYYLDNYVFGSALGENSAKEKLFLHFIMLGYIWNHPALMLEYLEQSKKKLTDSKKKSALLEELEDYDEIGGGRKKKATLVDVSNILATWEFDKLPPREMLYEPKYGAKFSLLFSIIEESAKREDKLLVFSQSLLTLDLIEAFLKQRMLQTAESWLKGTDYFRIDGSVNSDDRTKYIEQINNTSNKAARLMLISTKAGGVGINLVGANRAIIFDTCWNPANDVQAIYRIFRYGQTKPVYVYRFAAHGTMEEKIYKRQVQKQSVSLRVVDEFQVERHFEESALKELYELECNEEETGEPPMPPTNDPALWRVFADHRDVIAGYHHHNSLLENLPQEKLSNEEERDAWNEYLAAADAATTNIPPNPQSQIPSVNTPFAPHTFWNNGGNPSMTSTPQQQQPFSRASVPANYYAFKDQYGSFNGTGSRSVNSPYKSPLLMGTPGYQPRMAQQQSNLRMQQYSHRPGNARFSNGYQNHHQQQSSMSLNGNGQYYSPGGGSQYGSSTQRPRPTATATSATAQQLHPYGGNSSNWNGYNGQSTSSGNSGKQFFADNDIPQSPEENQLLISLKQTEADQLYSTYLQRQADFEMLRPSCQPGELNLLEAEISEVLTNYTKKMDEIEFFKQVGQFNFTSTHQSPNNSLMQPSVSYGNASFGDSYQQQHNSTFSIDSATSDDDVIFLG